MLIRYHLHKFSGNQKMDLNMLVTIVSENKDALGNWCFKDIILKMSFKKKIK